MSNTGPIPVGMVAATGEPTIDAYEALKRAAAQLAEAELDLTVTSAGIDVEERRFYAERAATRAALAEVYVRLASLADRAGPPDSRGRQPSGERARGRMSRR